MQRSQINDTSLVSVLVPLYNHEKYLVYCLDSIANEGWPRIELIIRDDCSTDNSLQVARTWASNNAGRLKSIRVIEGSLNTGIAGSLNLLVAEASGDYICPLASDDALAPGGIAARIHHLESNPALLAVFSDAELIDNNNLCINKSTLFGHYKSNSLYLNNPATRRMEMLHRWSVPGPVILYRQESFDASKGIGLYDETLRVEDRDIYLRLLEQGALGFLNIVVAQYRLHESNAIADPKTVVKRSQDLVTPLLKISTSRKLNLAERYVAKHIALALNTKTQADTTTNLLIKLVKRIQAFLHKKPARTLAKAYCKAVILRNHRK